MKGNHMIYGNREYKSDVFSMLLEDPEKALSLFNAMNDSDYKDPSIVEISKLENSISLTVRNDASFIVDNYLSLYEHQSTVCPNMPLRLLYYFSDILKRITDDEDIYGNKLIKIPTPRFAVFYNGEKNQPEVYTQKLSDAFEHPEDEPELELKCKIYNINPGYNEEFLDKCGFLKEYMLFIDCVRKNIASYGRDNLEKAIDDAIKSSIEQNILKDFLLKRKSDVVKTMTLDYTYERRLELTKRDYKEEGIKEGKLKQLVDLASEGLLQISVAAEKANMSETEFEKLIKK